MYNVNKTNSVLKNYAKVIIPVTKQLANLMDIYPSESDIYNSCKGIRTFDKQAVVLREIVRRLCLVYTRKRQYSSITAMTLKADCKSLDAACENSFFHAKALTQACRYLIPDTIAGTNEIDQLLESLIMWKQNSSFQRFPALRVVLILYLLQRLIAADQRLFEYMDILVEILIESPPRYLAEELFEQLDDLLFKLKLAEAGKNNE